MRVIHDAVPFGRIRKPVAVLKPVVAVGKTAYIKRPVQAAGNTYIVCTGCSYCFKQLLMAYACNLLAVHRYHAAVSPHVPRAASGIVSRGLYIVRLIQQPEKYGAVVFIFFCNLKPHIEAFLYRHNICVAVKNYILSPCLRGGYHIVYMLPVFFGRHRHALVLIVIAVKPIFRLYGQTYNIALPAVVYLRHGFIKMLGHSPAQARNIHAAQNHGIIRALLNEPVALYLYRHSPAVIYNSRFRCGGSFVKIRGGICVRLRKHRHAQRGGQ